MNTNIFDENRNVSENKPIARCLSQVATTEILGDNLCVLFAIGKNGEIVRFYPYGTNVAKKDKEHKKFQIPDECGEDAVCLEISVRIPKCDLNIPECDDLIDAIVNCDDELLAAPRRRSCCKLGGTEQPC